MDQKLYEEIKLASFEDELEKMALPLSDIMQRIKPKIRSIMTKVRSGAATSNVQKVITPSYERISPRFSVRPMPLPAYVRESL